MNWRELEGLTRYYTKEELISINSYNTTKYAMGAKTLKAEINTINDIIKR